jgi:chemotaxis protein histidine kinase CheA
VTQAGSGQGLALHSTLLAVIGGSLSVESEPGVYTRVRIRLPGEDTA